MSKPSLPEGTRDFGPSQLTKRNYILDIIKKTFRLFGFLPLETPSMEKLSTLTGKYGEEGDKLLFKILNNGDFLQKANSDALAAKDSSKLVSSICDRGLRYDLTVPFARYVAMNRNDLAFPFKRYQIQPVWRADRPQKGRYREFYQCDVDVVGSNSLVYEAELIQIYDLVFQELGLKVVIKYNNRKILEGLAQQLGVADKFVDMTVAIDKLDKIGLDGVQKELEARGFSETAIDAIRNMLSSKNLESIGQLLYSNEVGNKGLDEIRKVQDFLSNVTLHNTIEFDPTLARGLSYYTGCIFEVVVDTEAHPAIVMGSIGGGGRYDNLTGVFGLPDVSGVGVSFGLERIYDVMESASLFPENILSDAGAKVIILAMDETAHSFGFRCVNDLRMKGIAAEIYPEPVKIRKQMEYANKRSIPYVIVIGEEEMTTKILTIKNMHSGEQLKSTLEDWMKEYLL